MCNPPLPPLNPCLVDAAAHDRDNDAERRCEQRTGHRSRAQLMRYPPGRHAHFIDVTVTDFSELGMCVEYSEGLMAGQLFVVREPHLTAGQTCLYSVARSERSAAGTYSIGLRAVNSLSEDEWAPFAPPPAPGLDLGTKLAYLIFAVAGAATIVLTALTWRYPR